MRKARSDREFLPAALSILETPPSPVKVWLIWAICGLFAFVIAWSYFGRINIIAVAQGKIQPTGRVKTVQPVDGGKVVAVHVENGKHVAPGEVLVELDAAETSADYENAHTALQGYRAERLRRMTALAAVQEASVNTQASIDWPEDIRRPIGLAKNSSCTAISANWRLASKASKRSSRKRRPSRSA